mmetsp:Transcript_4784/g.10273  ORF Transcript_4784/g.10273 Transcript_4784/m.10273 type:complete len:246 (+) Transcript_4784:1217-1954(+)
MEILAGHSGDEVVPGRGRGALASQASNPSLCPLPPVVRVGDGNDGRGVPPPGADASPPDVDRIELRLLLRGLQGREEILREGRRRQVRPAAPREGRPRDDTIVGEEIRERVHEDPARGRAPARGGDVGRGDVPGRVDPPRRAGAPAARGRDAADAEGGGALRRGVGGSAQALEDRGVPGGSPRLLCAGAGVHGGEGQQRAGGEDAAGSQRHGRAEGDPGGRYLPLQWAVPLPRRRCLREASTVED